MGEEIYVLLNVDDENKKIFVDKKIFALGSEAEKKARLAEKDIYTICISKNYDVYCNDSLVTKFSQVKQQIYEEQEKEIKAAEYKRKMDEIREKDLLAKSRVHRDKTYRNAGGELVRQMGTTFEKEYKKIIDLIEERRNTPKR